MQAEQEQVDTTKSYAQVVKGEDEQSKADQKQQKGKASDPKPNKPDAGTRTPRSEDAAMGEEPVEEEKPAWDNAPGFEEFRAGLGKTQKRILDDQLDQMGAAYKKLKAQGMPSKLSTEEAAKRMEAARKMADLVSKAQGQRLG